MYRLHAIQHTQYDDIKLNTEAKTKKYGKQQQQQIESGKKEIQQHENKKRTTYERMESELAKVEDEINLPHKQIGTEDYS